MSISLHSQSVDTKSIFESDFNGNSTSAQSPIKPTSPDAFSLELSRLQEEQINYMRKTEREKQRKEMVTVVLEEAKLTLRAIQEKTKNGNIAKDHDMVNKKRIGRLEHQLQTSKIKLSVARNENAVMKKKVQDLRRDKLLNLQILNDLSKEAHEARRKNKQATKEVLSINEKKHKAKLGIVNIKHKMLRDMEEFSRELYVAKQNISSTQTNIMGTIREKLATTYASAKFGLDTVNLSATVNTTDPDNVSSSQLFAESLTYRQTEMESLLRDTDFNTLEELLGVLQASEEKMFVLYGETQSKNEEMEKMDLENRHLEGQVEEQLTRLRGLEGHHEQVKEDLEKAIQALQTQIDRYDADYQKNLELLASFSESLISLLKNVAIDHAALDQQLLSTGITDRNIDDYLGLVEQRIDDLIQMSKAAHHQAIRRDDFMKTMPMEHRGGNFAMPALPSLQDTGDDDDDNDAADSAVKLHPVDIGALKEFMWKKVQKITVVNATGGAGAGQKKQSVANAMNNSGVTAIIPSRQSSKVSIKSSDSNGRLK